jgi:hypothetical protein
MALRSRLAGVITRLSMLSLTVITFCFSGSTIARAAVILSVQPATAAAGSSGNAFDVDLTNSGPASLTVGSFSFGIVTANFNISFTDANTSTTDPYIFAGHSLFGPDLSGPTSGQSLSASDLYAIPGSGFTLGAGRTVGLGHVLFDVSPSSTAGTFPVSLDVFPVTILSDPSGNSISIASLVPGEITITGGMAVPEPSSLLLFLTGAMLIAGLGLRYQAAARS